MAGNTSATGGYLAPLVASPPLEDSDLDGILQGIIVGIVGLNGTLVRPRWQPIDPKQPPQSTDWCAIGVTDSEPDANAAVVHFSGTGVDDLTAYDQLQRHEILTVLASFYGPNSQSNAATLREGFQISQNRETLFLNGMGYVDCDRTVNAAELINNIWTRRRDVAFRIRRIIVRTYPVLNIREAQGTVENDDGQSTSFDTEEVSE